MGHPPPRGVLRPAFPASAGRPDRRTPSSHLAGAPPLIWPLHPSGHRWNILGLGPSEGRATKEKLGRNPKTGECITIPAGRKVVFKTAKGLKDQM